MMGSLNHVPFPVPKTDKLIKTLVKGSEPYCGKINELSLQLDEALAEDETGFHTDLDAAVAGNQRYEALQREMGEFKITEENQAKDFNSLRLDELHCTEEVKTKHVLVIAKKCELATNALNTEWRDQHEKWKTRLEKAVGSSESVSKLVEEFGIKPISDQETSIFSGIGLSRLDPAFPDYEGVVYFSEFNLAEWSFKEVLSVEPKFPELKSWLEETNRRKDLLHTLSTIRRHWANYFASTIKNNVNLSSIGEESSSAAEISVIQIKSSDNNKENKNPLVNNSGNNSSVLFDEDV